MAGLIDRLFCRFGKCRKCRHAGDATGQWGECVTCGKRHGFVSSAELRTIGDMEFERTKRERIHNSQSGCGFNHGGRGGNWR